MVFQRHANPALPSQVTLRACFLWCYSKIHLWGRPGRQTRQNVFEAGWGQVGVTNGVLDILVPQVRLQSPCVVALGSQRETAGVPQHVRVRLKTRFLARPLDHTRAKPAIVKGEPCSDVNTGGDFGSWSRCSRRSQRSSGWYLCGLVLF
ncbi:hypothetical protein V1283_002375 [Bradyrhizobium sp. AZCC 2262]